MRGGRGCWSRRPIPKRPIPKPPKGVARLFARVRARGPAFGLARLSSLGLAVLFMALCCGGAASAATTYTVDRDVYGRVPFASEVEACDVAHSLLVAAFPAYADPIYQHVVWASRCIEIHGLSNIEGAWVNTVNWELLGPISSAVSAPVSHTEDEVKAFRIDSVPVQEVAVYVAAFVAFCIGFNSRVIG